MIRRNIENQIINDFKKKKIITLLGPRQVGKTTLLHQILELQPGEVILQLNCDDEDDKLLLENKSTSELRALIGKNKLVVIDEAQRVNNIGLTLKCIFGVLIHNKKLISLKSVTVNCRLMNLNGILKPEPSFLSLSKGLIPTPHSM